MIPTTPARPLLVACMVVVTGIPAGHAGGSDPEELPRIERTTAKKSQADWMALKGVRSLKAQLARIDKRHLLLEACDDLVDLRDLSKEKLLEGFAYRDYVRGRSWARPSMALLLAEAMKRFQAEYPGRLVAIGDVSQPGCGQLSHGVLVKHVSGRAARRLLEAARLELSEPTVTEIRTAGDFRWEADRFERPDERVLVTTRLIATDGDGDSPTLRVAQTRYVEQPAPNPEEVAELEPMVTRLMKSTRVRSERVTSEDPAGVRTKLWISHWISPSARRQLVLVTTTKPGSRLDWATVREARLASWQDKKPGSFPGEVRWVVNQLEGAGEAPAAPKRKARRRRTPITELSFSRWAMMYEAGHISHLSGIDADLSYVTVDDTRHFAVDLDVLDVKATWRWLNILEETGRDLKTPVEAILVAPSIKRKLGNELPRAARRTRTWRLLKLVGGHDAHHHLRIEEPSKARERVALERLRKGPAQ